MATDRSSHTRARVLAGLASQQSPQRVYNILRSAIRSGILGVGDVLGEEDLTTATSTSRNAVREALSQLAKDGLITRVRRRGTVVSASIHTVPISANRRSEQYAFSVEVLEERIVPCTDLLATILNSSDPTIKMNEYLLLRDGIPFGVQTSYVRNDGKSLFQARIERDAEAGSPQRLSMAEGFAAIYGVPLHTVEASVEATTCDRRTAALLQLEEGAPLLARERRLSDADGRFVELIFTNFRADHAGIHSTVVLDPDGTVHERSVSDLTDV